MTPFFGVLPDPVDKIFVFLLGLLFGSFYNVCIFRLAEDKSLMGRSKCRHCDQTVPWFLNIPVLSYFWLKGKTRCCGKPLTVQYPFVEFLTACLFLALYLHFGAGPQWLCYTIFCSFLLILSVIDFHHQIIPDELSLSGIPLGFAACFFTQDITWTSSLIGILVGGGVFFSIAYLYEKISGREGLGGGDVKLLAMLGAWLGIESILPIILVSTFMGSVVGLTLIALRRATSKAAIPFGPFLAIAAVLYLFLRTDLLPYFYPLLYPS